MLPTVLYCTASPDPNQNNEKVYIMNVQLSSYAVSINTYRNIKEDIVLHVTKAHWLMSIQFRFLLLCHTFFFLSLSLSLANEMLSLLFIDFLSYYSIN